MIKSLKMSSTGCFILDGGMATELENMGFSLNDDPLWSSRILHSDPNAVKRVHKSFLDAGSDVIETNTYQASLEGFQNHLHISAQESLQLMASGVRLAIEAREEFWSQYCNLKESNKQVEVRKKPLVAGSVGPYGACQHDGSEYTGLYADHMSIEELMCWHRPRMESLLSCGVDLLAIETIPAEKEANALLKLLRQFPNSKAWLSFSCKDSIHTSHGEKFHKIIKMAKEMDQIVAVGVNCCSPSLIKPIFQNCSDFKKDFVAYPNSGEAWIDHKWTGKASCEPLSDLVVSWVGSLGVKWVGGCCRTGPSDIKNIRDKLYGNSSGQ